jgi:long-chain alkane monooxygenase
VPGIQGPFESIIYAKGGAPVTVGEAAIIYAQGMGMPVACGTPKDIADLMEHYTDDGGADGFMLIATTPRAASKNSSIWWCRSCSGEAAAR